MRKIFSEGFNVPFIKNSKGTKDAMLTIAIMFAIAGWIGFLFGGTSLDVAGQTINFSLKIKDLDSASVSVLMTTLSAYIVRRHGIGIGRKTEKAEKEE